MLSSLVIGLFGNDSGDLFFFKVLAKLGLSCDQKLGQLLGACKILRHLFIHPIPWHKVVVCGGIQSRLGDVYFIIRRVVRKAPDWRAVFRGHRTVNPS